MCFVTRRERLAFVHAFAYLRLDSVVFRGVPLKFLTLFTAINKGRSSPDTRTCINQPLMPDSVALGSIPLFFRSRKMKAHAYPVLTYNIIVHFYLPIKTATLCTDNAQFERKYENMERNSFALVFFFIRTGSIDSVFNCNRK